MNIETNRLNTFANWPASTPVDPIRIAKGGFFYTGEGTEVQCFSCGGKISDWNYGDQVMSRHRRLAASCAFLVDPQGSGNVPFVLGRECPVDTSQSSSEWQQIDSLQHLDYGGTLDDQMYRTDALRLLSFSNWEDSSVSREALAGAGFYHAGQGRLRCAWCGGELSPFRNFGSLGQPLEVHRMYFPHCTHAASIEAARRSVSISPLASSPSYTPPLQSPSDTASSQPQSSGAAHNERLLAAGGAWRTLGVVGGGAKHPSQTALASRLATFERWPADRTQTPRALAEAGFFYTGTDDQVRCFYCDGGLGKWEAGDAPWWEHAHWFPHCGYVTLVKGQQFVDSCRQVAPTISGVPRRRNTGVNFPVDMQQVNEFMESEVAAAALGAGLDAARVRRSIVHRLRATGSTFNSSEALIDAVLDEQLNEEPWGVSSRSQRLARDILAETLRDFAPGSGLIPSSFEDSSNSRRSESPASATTPIPDTTQIDNGPIEVEASSENGPINAECSKTEPIENRDGEKVVDNGPEKKLTLEEENRQLKEARLCKVCMDSEVSVVFLPCGHLVSCGGCGAALSACPLCRCGVRALVRAYLA